MERYYNIRYMSRPQYDDLPNMSRHDRAAQFSPFAALTGYDDAVNETARYTESRRELTEDEIIELNARLAELTDRLNERPMVSVTYFLPDEKKAGGSYVTKRGALRLIDGYENVLIFTDGDRIPIEQLFSVITDKK